MLRILALIFFSIAGLGFMAGMADGDGDSTPQGSLAMAD